MIMFGNSAFNFVHLVVTWVLNIDSDSINRMIALVSVSIATNLTGLIHQCSW
jgi:hypothetical protein